MNKEVEQAIQYVDNACSSLQADRSVHVRLQEAITVIRKAVEKPKKAPTE